MNSVIIYLIGFPGTGKYTIAKELRKYGYRICDNHLVNNPLFSLLEVDGVTEIPKNVWNAVGRIRDVVFDFISQETQKNYVFTNVLLDDVGDHALYSRVKNIAVIRKSYFIPVRLFISPEENARRIVVPERSARFKQIDRDEAFIEKKMIHIQEDNLFDLEVTHLSAKEAANRIMFHVDAVIGEHN